MVSNALEDLIVIGGAIYMATIPPRHVGVWYNET
jgi:hypothetical protein